MQGCTTDSFGIVHGQTCARAKASEAALEEWKADMDSQAEEHESHHETQRGCYYCAKAATKC